LAAESQHACDAALFFAVMADGCKKKVSVASIDGSQRVSIAVPCSHCTAFAFSGFWFGCFHRVSVALSWFQGSWNRTTVGFVNVWLIWHPTMGFGLVASTAVL